MSRFKYQFLMLTHFFVTCYVALDAFTTTKLMYVTMAVIYLISLLQLLYGGARPFWASNSILSSSCLRGFSHPSLGLMLSLFVPYYGFYCWKKKTGEMFVGKMSTKELAIAVGLLVLIGVV